MDRMAFSRPRAQYRFNQQNLVRENLPDPFFPRGLFDTGMKSAKAYRKYVLYLRVPAAYEGIYHLHYRLSADMFCSWITI
jgi:hypothetical protein